MKPCKCCEETRDAITDALQKTLGRYRNGYEGGALECAVREGVDEALRDFDLALRVTWYTEAAEVEK